MSLPTPLRMKMVPGLIAFGGWWSSVDNPGYGAEWAQDCRGPDAAIHVFPQHFHKVPPGKVQLRWVRSQ